MTALDDCLDAMLSGVPGMAGEQLARPELGLELKPLLAVAGELVRSREWIDERLAQWRDSLPLVTHVGAPGDAFLNAGRWPGLN